MFKCFTWLRKPTRILMRGYALPFVDRKGKINVFVIKAIFVSGLCGSPLEREAIRQRRGHQCRGDGHDLRRLRVGPERDHHDGGIPVPGQDCHLLQVRTLEHNWE